MRIKNARGDRCTVILIPEEEVAVVDPPTGRPATATVDEQNLTMTRSLGDFHAHRYGVSHAPDVRTFALAELLAGADGGGVAALCSDGVWDLMDEREVGEVLLGRRRGRRRLPRGSASRAAPPPSARRRGRAGRVVRRVGRQFDGRADRPEERRRRGGVCVA